MLRRSAILRVIRAVLKAPQGLDSLLPFPYEILAVFGQNLPHFYIRKSDFFSQNSIEPISELREPIFFSEKL